MKFVALSNRPKDIEIQITRRYLARLYQCRHELVVVFKLVVLRDVSENSEKQITRRCRARILQADMNSSFGGRNGEGGRRGAKEAAHVTKSGITRCHA